MADTICRTFDWNGDEWFAGKLETDTVILRNADGNRRRVAVRSGQLVMEPVTNSGTSCQYPQQAKGKHLFRWLGKSPGGKDEVSQFCRPFVLSWKDYETSERKSEWIRFFAHVHLGKILSGGAGRAK